MSHHFDFSALERFSQATKSFDERAAAIISFHAALDHEMDIVLARFFEAPQHLRRFGFGHKVDLVHAVTGEYTDRICAALAAFNDLRNSVGHGDAKDEVDKFQLKLFQRFVDVTEILNKEASVPTSIDHVAAGLFGMLAGLRPR